MYTSHSSSENKPTRREIRLLGLYLVPLGCRYDLYPWENRKRVGFGRLVSNDRVGRDPFQLFTTSVK